jgi:suppressor of ftsI
MWRLLPFVLFLPGSLTGPVEPGPAPGFCGVDPPPAGSPDPDLYCVDLLPRFEVGSASGWGEMRPAPSPFGLALDRDGTVRWTLRVEVRGLPDPRTLDPEATAWVAWATGPNLVPELRLGVVDEGRPATGEVALDKFRILVTAERDPQTAERTGPISLRGDSPSMRLLPHEDPWLFMGGSGGPGGHDHGGEPAHGAAHGADHGDGPRAGAGDVAPLSWRMPPMHPQVPMPPGLDHLAPWVTPWLPGAHLSAEAVAALPEAGVTRRILLANGESMDLEAGPVRRTIRGREHVLFGYNGQLPGPHLVVEAGSTVRIRAVNELPFSTAVHWHGLRLDNRFDGVPGVTQDPILPGEAFHYQVAAPDPGLFWYHPHLWEDATQGLGLYGNLRVLPRPAPEDPAAPPSFAHREVAWILDDLLVHEDGSLVPFGLEAPTHALMGRFGNVLLVNGEERPVLDVDRGEVVRLLLTNAAAARPFHLVVGEPGQARVKLVGTDLSAFEREAWVEGLVIAPAERYVVEVRFDTPGRVAVENRVRGVDPFYGTIFPDVDTVAFVQVRDTPAPAPPPASRPFDALHVNARVLAEVDPLRAHLQREPDHELVLAMEVGEIPFPLRPMMQMDSAFFSPVEWVETMPEMNWPLTPREVRWILRDEATGRENGEIDWRFRQGDLVRLRVRNEREVLHAMQHPVHVHGQRFLVLSLNGVPQENLAWKDTFLLPVGWTAELLVEMSNPGDWMIHCHISEHLEAGMQTVFRVDPAEGPPWEGWRGFEPGLGLGHGSGHGPGREPGHEPGHHPGHEDGSSPSLHPAHPASTLR